MRVTHSPKVMSFKEMQLAKASSPISITDSIKICVKDMHLIKLLRPIWVTHLPRMTHSKELHSQKVQSPMSVTESLIMILVKEVHSAKTDDPRYVTDCPMEMSCKDAQSKNAHSSMRLIDSGRVMLSKEVQPLKACSPMHITDSGMVTLTISSAPSKAQGEIASRVEGIITWKNPLIWISCNVEASTSFLVYITITSESLSKPTSLNVGESSNKEPSRKSSTFRNLRSIRSSQGCFSRSMFFSSLTVLVGRTSIVMTRPSKVFKCSSNDMAANGTHQTKEKSMRKVQETQETSTWAHLQLEF